MKKIILSLLCFGFVSGSQLLGMFPNEEEQLRQQVQQNRIDTIKRTIARDMMRVYGEVIPTDEQVESYLQNSLAVYERMDPSEDRNNHIEAIRQLLPSAGR